MKPTFIALHVVAVILFLCGLGVLLSGKSQPVYTNPKAPEELSLKLQDLPRDQRFQQWYEQLAKFETPHKRLTDLGRGWMAFGIGIAMTALFLRFLAKANPKRIGLWIAAYWTALWAIKFPLTMWYYTVRHSRFDYPVWGDSIAIGVFQDCFVWILGFIAFSILLLILMIGHQFSSRISLRKPNRIWPWLRTIALWLWILLLAACVYSAIPDGDEGMVLSCTGAIPVVLLALSAQRKEQRPAALLTPDPPQGECFSGME